jgi:hypothetical protein
LPFFSARAAAVHVEFHSSTLGGEPGKTLNQPKVDELLFSSLARRAVRRATHKCARGVQR